MKKLTLIVLLFISFASLSQNKFIEVEVTDTISLKPVNFQCNIYAGLDEAFSFNEEGDYDMLAAEEKVKNRLEEVKTMLESKKYKVGPLDESRLNVLERRRSGQKGLTVFVNGPAEMQKLKDLLSPKEDIQTIVTVLKYADELKAEEQLIKRLIGKAKERAAIIGASSELKVGRILEVKEGKKSGDTGLADFYSQIAKMGNYGSENDNLTGSLSKTFVVKFAAE
ncbi:hypothetical protein D3C87_588800 [compost metagenome]